MAECIPWWGKKTSDGYGSWSAGGLAHRRIWEACFGPIEAGHVIHHECRNRVCVNPEHLRSMLLSDHLSLHNNPRAWWERQRALTHCKRGHEFTEKNTGWYRGRRRCRSCDCDQHREAYQRSKALRAAG